MTTCLSPAIRGFMTATLFMTIVNANISCRCNDDQVTDVRGPAVQLILPRPADVVAAPATPHVVLSATPTPTPTLITKVTIHGRESPTPDVDSGDTATVPPLTDLASSGPPPVPPGAFVADDLTQRLKEKMAQAYNGDMTKVPSAKIYLSNGNLDEFINFYEQRGYRVQRMSVSVQRILQPVLRDRPELASKIHIEDYTDAVIHQAMVEGTGISAADRYIDPDSYELVNRLFVTEMPVK